MHVFFCRVSAPVCELLLEALHRSGDPVCIIILIIIIIIIIIVVIIIIMIIMIVMIIIMIIIIVIIIIIIIIITDIMIIMIIIVCQIRRGLYAHLHACLQDVYFTCLRTLSASHRGLLNSTPCNDSDMM